MAASLKMVDGNQANGMKSSEREKALEAALAQIDRAFGKGSAMKLGSREAIAIDAVSTGSLGLDIALGIGGLPKGRVIEIYGPESSGKTTLTLHAIAEAQKAGGTAAFIDAEHALDPGYAKKLGVDIDNLIVSQPDTGEQALEIADTLVRQPCRLASPFDEPGASQNYRFDQPVELHGDFHQPDPHENRCDVRFARNDHGR
jgi:recombination protein RecA